MLHRKLAIFVPDESTLTKTIRQLGIQTNYKAAIYSPFLDNLEFINQNRDKRHIFYVDSLDSNKPLPDGFNVFDFFEYLYEVHYLPPQFESGYRVTLIKNKDTLETGFVGMLVTKEMDNLLQVLVCKSIYPDMTVE